MDEQLKKLTGNTATNCSVPLQLSGHRTGCIMPTRYLGSRAKGLRQEGRPDKDRFLDVCLQPTKLLTPH
jgi:hypothetical protein